MPQQTIYIRNDDMPKWKALENKSEFLSNALNNSIPEFKEPIKAPVNIPGVVRGADFVPKPPDPETGYPCCTKARPCKHWVWDDIETVWRNTLTNKTREE